jgi:hypothetical protein
MPSSISLALSLLLATRIEAPAPAPEGPAIGPTLDTAAPTSSASARPPEPRWRGTGLLVTAGVLGGIGFGANVGRVIAASRLCKDLSWDAETQQAVGLEECAFGGAALGILAPVALLSNAAAFGFAAGGGSMRGRWDAHRTAFAGARQQNGALRIGLGAGVMTAGLIAYLGFRIGSYADLLGLDTCNERYPLLAMNGEDVDAMQGNVPGFRQCMGRRMGGYLAGIGVGQAMSVVGVGLLTQGVAYNRNLKLMRYIARHQLRLQPTLTFNYAGLSLSGRF